MLLSRQHSREIDWQRREIAVPHPPDDLDALLALLEQAIIATDRSGYEMVSYLLSMAKLEADEQVRRRNKGRPRPA